MRYWLLLVTDIRTEQNRNFILDLSLRYLDPDPNTPPHPIQTLVTGISLDILSFYLYCYTSSVPNTLLETSACVPNNVENRLSQGHHTNAMSQVDREHVRPYRPLNPNCVALPH